MSETRSLRAYSQDSINKYSIFAIFFVSIVISGLLMVHSYQTHTRQTNTWIETLPGNLLTHLIDSDYFSISSKLKLIESTELFDCFEIYDRLNVRIDGFGQSCQLKEASLIRDAAGETWGKYRHSPNYLGLVLPAIVFIILSLASVVFIHLAFRRRLTSGLDSELETLQNFTRRIYEISEQVKTQEALNSKIAIPLGKAQSEESKNLEEAFGNLIQALESREDKIKELVSQRVQQQAAEKLGHITLKVAHDLRSPLSALKIVASSIGEDNKFQQLIKTATSRIESIANDVLLMGKTKEPSAQSKPLIEMIELLIREKEIANPQIGLVFTNSVSKAYLLQQEDLGLERVLSNIIQNSIDASSEGAEISIDLSAGKNDLALTVSDRGKGIPSHVISKIGTMGFSYDKKNGNGLGFSSAQEFVSARSGRIELSSEVNVGTIVRIYLPSTMFSLKV